MLYTRKGDGGISGLFGTKERLPKSHALYEALGTLDELNSLLGVSRTQAAALKEQRIAQELKRVQETLFTVQASLAGADKKIGVASIESLERVIDSLEEVSGNPHAFVIPGATPLSATLDYARAVARRAERSVVRITAVHQVSHEVLAYLNRLSSLLYACARYVAVREGVQEDSPTYS